MFKMKRLRFWAIVRYNVLQFASEWNVKKTGYGIAFLCEKESNQTSLKHLWEQYEYAKSVCKMYRKVAKHAEKKINKILNS